MEISKLLPAEQIFLYDPDGKSKEDLIQELFRKSAEHSGLGEYQNEVCQALIERERSMSTGIGQGVAIPHCSSERVADVHAALALLPEGIDFESVDDQPVKVVVLLLLPKNKFEKHIKTLAAVARMFNNAEFRDRILAAKSSAEAAELIAAEETRMAAR